MMKFERNMSKIGEDIKYNNPIFTSKTTVNNEDWTVVFTIEEFDYDSDPLTGYEVFRSCKLIDFYENIKPISFLKELQNLKKMYENFSYTEELAKKLGNAILFCL